MPLIMALCTQEFLFNSQLLTVREILSLLTTLEAIRRQDSWWDVSLIHGPLIIMIQWVDIELSAD